YDAGVRDRSQVRQSPRRSAWSLLIGRPLRASKASKEQITPVEGLSALSLDALTSVAYGPEAIIVVLAVAGGGALHVVLPITVAIVVLLAILVFSYRQVIDAYPGGGGAYAVSRANLGPRASLVAGASLIVDYTLTVAVSIAAGVGALTSAFPSLTSATVPLCLGFLALITLMNLRGLGEAARAFLLPTMLFILGLLAIIAVGLIHPLALHARQPGHSLLRTHGLQAVSLLLILKAFSSCCWVWLFWPDAGVSDPDRTRPYSAKSWAKPWADIGPTTSCPSPSPWCSRWPQIPRSGAYRSWPACWHATTICPISFRSAAIGRSLPTAYGGWLGFRPG